MHFPQGDAYGPTVVMPGQDSLVSEGEEKHKDLLVS